MTKTEDLNALFQDWAQNLSDQGLASRVNDFCEDGIIDEVLWEKAPTKVLFIAKETNGYPGDLRDLIKKEPHGWKPVGVWAYALQNAARNPSYSDATKPENHTPALWSSAVMNLKKLSGGASSNMKEILEAARRDAKQIHDQIKIIQPTVIVCCGTFSVIKDIIPEVALKEPEDSDGRCFRIGKTLWIDFCHFGAHFRHDMMYYSLQSFYRSALEIK